jgi:hypothetical protein
VKLNTSEEEKKDHKKSDSSATEKMILNSF